MKRALILPVLAGLGSIIFMGQFWVSEKAKIEKAVQDYLDKNPDCVVVDRFPLVTPYPAHEANREANALAAAGLAKFLGTIQSKPALPPEYDKYELTALGKQYYHNGKFCAGKKKLQQIEKYTTPSPTRAIAFDSFGPASPA